LADALFLSPPGALPGACCTTIHTMKTTTHALTAAALALAFALSPLQAAPPPGVLNHQGRIAVSGANYTGTGHFKFALVDAAGTTTLWSNNNSSTGGAQPSAAVQVSVSQGHYALGLGDTALANMTAAIPPSVFVENADVRLRVWFSTNGTTFEQLTPDRRITATGYALSAGAVADPSFVGTTGNTSLDFVVNNQRALRLQPSPTVGNPIPNLIGGHPDNIIDASLYGSVIGGGGAPGAGRNAITGLGYLSVIGGGFDNASDEQNTFIGGGVHNRTSAQAATVAGGDTNLATGAYSTVAGGAGNTASGFGGMVPGGNLNIAGGSYSFAAGWEAGAMHSGAFVWADSQGVPFSSTSDNQFLIRAAGGVGINKNNPTVALDVNGTVKATAFQGMGAPLVFSTTDNQPLTFSVNNQRALRLEFTGASAGANIIGGHEGNSISATSFGGIIAGGGLSGQLNAIQGFGDYSVIGGGKGNVVSAGVSTIAGGDRNTVSGGGATVGGGQFNSATANYSTVPGGASNTAVGQYSFAAGRQAKAIHDGAFVWADASGLDFSSTIINQFRARASGGFDLTVLDGGWKVLPPGGSGTTPNIIGGSQFNSINTALQGVFIGGGGDANSAFGDNDVEGTGDFATIGGGRYNRASQPDATIGGGFANNVSGSRATVAGGNGNTASGVNATVGGGLSNVASGAQATVPGGSSNVASGIWSFAAGEGARALHTASFVWADEAGVLFDSTAPDQFLIKAAGNVGINTNAPSHTLTISNTTNEETMRLIGPDGTSLGYGARLNFGDGDFVYLDENADDRLRIQANAVGIGRDGLANQLEVEGEASKTTAGSWLANSDARIKTDIEEVPGGEALAKLRAVRPVAFKYTPAYLAAHPSIKPRSYLNVVAQEFAEVFPEWVKSSGETLPGADAGDSRQEILQVDTYPLSIYSVAAIKELDACHRRLERETMQREKRVVELEKENAALKERLERLERVVEAMARPAVVTTASNQ
jgi:hypothetical protein